LAGGDPRAWALIRFDPRTYRHKSRRLDQAAIEQRIKEICQTRVRFGCRRRVHVLLRREGRKIRIPTVVDTFSRYVPVLDAKFSYKGEDVVARLDRVCRQVGYPKTIRVDNGSEFISRDMDLWAYQRNVTLDFSRPGKPTDNA